MSIKELFLELMGLVLHFWMVAIGIILFVGLTIGPLLVFCHYAELN